jgi:hypothetical protein
MDLTAFFSKHLAGMAALMSARVKGGGAASGTSAWKGGREGV